MSDKDGTSYCGLAEDVTRGLILKVEGLEARLKATYDTGIAELNRMDGLYKAALERAEKAEALRAVERAPEAPALDAVFWVLIDKARMSPDLPTANAWIDKALAQINRTGPSAPLRDAKRVEETGAAHADRLKSVGYAPGGYDIACHRCLKTASGCDKRATTCHPCAVAMLATPTPKERAPDLEERLARLMTPWFGFVPEEWHRCKGNAAEVLAALATPPAGPAVDLEAAKKDLIVVWLDGDEAIVTTRKHPDEYRQGIGMVCWPAGVSGYYLEACVKPVKFHPSALARLRSPGGSAHG